MRFKEKLRLSWLLILSISLIVGCRSQVETPPTPTTTPALESPQPTETSAIDSPLPSPEPTKIPSEQAYPITNPTSAPPPQGYPLASPTYAADYQGEIVPFQLDRPIVAGSTRVTGGGPAGVPIVLRDITFGGPVLAQGVIEKSGRFALDIARPLEARHRIGIAIGNLEGTGWQAKDFSYQGFMGEQALSVPQVDFFYDSEMVRE